jgi:hypothetical protein
MCLRLIQNENEEDKNSDWFCWQWLNELNNWITYSPSIQIDLEKKFRLYKTGDGKKSDSTLKIIITNTSYLIDFVKMKQKNEKSGFSRDVKRVASGNILCFNIKLTLFQLLTIEFNHFH